MTRTDGFVEEEWTTKDGDKIPVGELEPAHLRNIMLMLKLDADGTLHRQRTRLRGWICTLRDNVEADFWQAIANDEMIWGWGGQG